MAWSCLHSTTRIQLVCLFLQKKFQERGPKKQGLVPIPSNPSWGRAPKVSFNKVGVLPFTNCLNMLNKVGVLGTLMQSFLQCVQVMFCRRKNRPPSMINAEHACTPSTILVKCKTVEKFIRLLGLISERWTTWRPLSLSLSLSQERNVFLSLFLDAPIISKKCVWCKSRHKWQLELPFSPKCYVLVRIAIRRTTPLQNLNNGNTAKLWKSRSRGGIT
jgi:hypothetical protein